MLYASKQGVLQHLRIHKKVKEFIGDGIHTSDVRWEKNTHKLPTTLKDYLSGQIAKTISNEICKELERRHKKICKLSVTLKCTMKKIISVETQEEHVTELYFTTLEPHRLVFHNADEIGQKIYDDIKRQIEDFNENGSGYMLISVDKLTFKFAYCDRPIGGCESDKLPAEFYRNHRIVDIKGENKEKNCIEMVIKCYFHLQKTNQYAKLQKDSVMYEHLEDVQTPYDFSTILFPFDAKHIKALENQTGDYRINLFQMEEINQGSYYLEVIYIGKEIAEEDDDNTINILLYKKHYHYIDNLNSLIQFINKTKARGKQTSICLYCLQSFDLRYLKNSNHVEMCKSRKRQQVKYSEPGIIKFESYNDMEKDPWFVASDFEATQIKIDEKVGQNTKNVMKHRINSILWILHIDDNLDNFPYDELKRDKLYQTIDDSKEEEERILNEFHEDMMELAKRLRAWKDTIEPEKQLAMLKSSGEYDEMLNSYSSCIYCNEMFTKDDPPVVDQDHYRSVIRGNVHSGCNFKAANRHKAILKIFFHSFKTYDSVPLIKYMRPGNDTELYCRARGSKICHLTCDQTIEYCDSIDLMPAALEKLGIYLQED